MLQLEKYKTKGSRFECPACGHDHKFARYVDEAGKLVAPEVGRCERINSCGYHLTPKEYFAAQPAINWTPRPKPQPKAQPKPVALGEIPQEYLTRSKASAEQNPFVQFLLSRYDREEVLQACERYFLGDFEGFTTFWRIDEAGHINTAKLIRYDARTGKRIKDGFSTGWLHAKLKKRMILPDDFDYRRCLFGQHLLHQGAPLVAVVESEKTAVIASLELPEYVWLACGGRTQLKSSSDDFRAFGKSRVILFPDGDSFEEWSKIAREARANGFDVRVSDLLEAELTIEQKAKGFDLADYLLMPEPATAPTVVEAVTPTASIPEQPAINVAPVIKPALHSNAAIFAGNCKQCGDYLQPDGSCDLCKRPLPF